MSPDVFVFAFTSLSICLSNSFVCVSLLSVGGRVSSCTIRSAATEKMHSEHNLLSSLVICNYISLHVR